MEQPLATANRFSSFCWRLCTALRWHVPFLAHIGELAISVAIFGVAGSALASPPSVNITAPANGSTASGIIPLSADATNDIAITKVEFYVDGVLLSTDTFSPYSVNWDARGASAGSHTVFARAYDALPSFDTSPTINVIIPDLVAPSVPANIISNLQSVSTIGLDWDPSYDQIGTTGYHVFRDGVEVGTPSSPTFNDSGLTPNTSYSYTISAYDASGNTSAASSAVSYSTLPDVTAPVTPANIRTTDRQLFSIDIAWNASSDDVATTGYNLYRNGALVGSPVSNNFSDSGLAYNTPYTYTVEAYDNAGNVSGLGSLLTSTLPDTTAPAVPANLNSTDRQLYTIDLAWDASADDVGTTGYRVYRGAVLIGSPAVNSFNDTGLDYDTSYNYSVKSVDASGNVSASSVTLNTSTLPDITAPDVPVNLNSPLQSVKTINLAWDASPDDTGTASYKVYRDGTLVASPGTNSFNDSGLIPNTNYSYEVEALDATPNTSARSVAYPISTLADTTAPAVPANILSTDRQLFSIDIAWNASSDDVATTGYDIYRGGVLLSTGAGTSYSDSGLSYNTSYTYTISSFDAVGNHSALGSLSTSTLPDTTAPAITVTRPTNLTTINESMNIAGSATDQFNVVTMRIFIDNLLVKTVSGDSIDYDWNTKESSNAVHSVKLQAVDPSGNTANSSVSVTVYNHRLGDLNNDDKVNIFDLSIILGRFGKSGAGDYNLSGKVDIYDLSLFLHDYGR